MELLEMGLLQTLAKGRVISFSRIHPVSRDTLKSMEAKTSERNVSMCEVRDRI